MLNRNGFRLLEVLAYSTEHIIYEVKQESNGNFIATGTYDIPSDGNLYLLKLNSAGDLIFENIPLPTKTSIYLGGEQ